MPNSSAQNVHIQGSLFLFFAMPKQMTMLATHMMPAVAVTMAFLLFDVYVIITQCAARAQSQKYILRILLLTTL